MNPEHIIFVFISKARKRLIFFYKEIEGEIMEFLLSILFETEWGVIVVGSLLLIALIIQIFKKSDN